MKKIISLKLVDYNQRISQKIYDYLGEKMTENNINNKLLLYENAGYSINEYYEEYWNQVIKYFNLYLRK